MKNNSRGRSLHLISAERKSADLLMERMGLSKRELAEISGRYGVSAAQLLDRMQCSKYEFVFPKKEYGRCTPCRPMSGIQVARFR